MARKKRSTLADAARLAEAGDTAAAEQLQKSDAARPKKALHVEISPEVKQAAKVRAVELDAPLWTVVEAALVEYLASD